MRDSILLTIIKWWCNCLDLCFEIVARPWKPEELHYRRMISTIFGQEWELKKSFKFFDTTTLPTTYKATRTQLIKFTRDFWNNQTNRRHMTPAWPEGSLAYLEELFDLRFAELVQSGETNETVIRAFRLLNEVGDKHIPRKLIAERLEVDQDTLLNEVARLERRLRGPGLGFFLRPFAFQDKYGQIEPIIQEWREKNYISLYTATIAEIEGRSVEELELSVRTYNALKNANIQTIGEILSTSEKALLQERNFGRKSLNELTEVLANINPLLKIGMHSKREPIEM